MLKDYSEGKVKPNKNNSFPNLALSPDLGDNTGHFLNGDNTLFMCKTSGKMFYKGCVKTLNQKGLNKS